MKIPLTIEQYILREQSPNATGKFTSIMTDVSLACRMIGALLRHGNLKGQMSKGTNENSSGDNQAPLDILSNNIFINLFNNNNNVAAILSEELEDIHYFKGREGAKYILIIDPLDGSANLEINAPVATIFSLCLNPISNNITDILEAARSPVASGICIYGLATTFAITIGNGVHGFSQDIESGAFFYTHPFMQIKSQAQVVAINYSNRIFWNNAVSRYVDECFLGEKGPRKRYFNTRWYASAAAELNRILIKGGIFIYPSCSNGKPKGVLRKVYEAWPMATLIEAAGGSATDGLNRVLDIPANSLHERTPFAMGSTEEIDLLAKYHADDLKRSLNKSANIASSSTAPV